MENAFVAATGFPRRAMRNATNKCTFPVHDILVSAFTWKRIALLVPNQTPRCNVRCSAQSDNRHAILLVDHGSRRREANELLNDIRDQVRSSVDHNVPVHAAHMELASPTIFDGITQCVADGARHVIVVPFFLSPGRHVSSDIPKLVKDAVSQFPGLTYEVRSHLGAHPALIDVIVDLGSLAQAVKT